MGRGQLLERSFETSICEALAQRGWLYDPGAADAGWDPRLALHPADVLAWLREQYPVEYAKATANSLAPADLERAERGFLEHLATVLSTDTKLDKGRGRPRGACSASCTPASTTRRSGAAWPRSGPWRRSRRRTRT